MTSETRPQAATLYGSTHDAMQARTDPATFLDFFGVFHPGPRAVAIAALEARPFDEWPEVVKPFAAPLPSIPVTAPGVLLSASPIGAAARPPPEAMKLVANSDGWHNRCVILCQILAQQIERLEGRPAHDWAAHMNALSLQWTAAVEQLELEPVQSLQHAVVLYATVHENWNISALQWLEHVAFTWWPLWRDRHPEVRVLLELKQAWGFPTAPWLLGRADA